MNFLSPEELGITATENAPLSRYTTFQLGGPCRHLYHCQRPDEVIRVVKYLNEHKRDFILIGGGSNLVVSDRGLEIDVIRYWTETPLIRRDGQDLIVSAATALDSLALFAANESMEGLNCTTGIPGTVGGAIVGNAGAFGKQVGDVLKSVIVLSKNGTQRTASPESLDFKYRYSNLKEKDDIVLEACFSLAPGDKQALLKERDKILSIRRVKHPDLKTHPCAGSFFRNIEPTSKAGRREAAGWFLDEAGGKSLSAGGAKIFQKHANIIVKGDGCTSQDVQDLSERMARLVKEKFNLDLVREVRFVGTFKRMPESPTPPIW